MQIRSIITGRASGLALTAALMLIAGCGGKSEPPAAATDTASDAPPKAEVTEGAALAPPEASLPRTPAPEGARVFIISPADGDTVQSPVTVKFGAENVTIVKAGDATPASGHHHLVINAPLPDFSKPVPANDNYIHFGGGQTETTLDLAPGEYELRLLLGDQLHIPHEPPIYSDPITITVE